MINVLIVCYVKFNGNNELFKKKMYLIIPNELII